MMTSCILLLFFIIVANIKVTQKDFVSPFNTGSTSVSVKHRYERQYALSFNKLSRSHGLFVVHFGLNLPEVAEN